jgi:hypothetical protein
MMQTQSYLEPEYLTTHNTPHPSFPAARKEEFLNGKVLVSPNGLKDHTQ